MKATDQLIPSAFIFLYLAMFFCFIFFNMIRYHHTHELSEFYISPPVTDIIA